MRVALNAIEPIAFSNFEREQNPQNAGISEYVFNWLLSRAWWALDIVNASLAVRYPCSGGATFSPQIFIWCETALKAIADLLFLNHTESTASSPQDESVLKPLDIASVSGQVLIVGELYAAVEKVLHKAGPISDDVASPIHPLLHAQLLRFRRHS